MNIITGKIYKEYQKPIFNFLELTIKEGEIYLVIGKNGVGKSTLLRILAQVDIDYHQFLKHSLAEHEISYMPSNLVYYPYMKIKDLLSFYKATRVNFDLEYAIRYLKAFRINPNRKINNLSDGEKKIVNFTLCLSNIAHLYVIDEPFPNVDVINDELFRKMIIERYSNHTTFIIATHQINESEILSSKCIFLKNENEIEVFNTDDLRDELSSSVENYFKERLRYD